MASTLYSCLPAGLTANLSSSARQFAKARRVGAYQEDLLENKQAWNQSDLKGRASEWRSKYKKAAALLLADLRTLFWNSQYYPYVKKGDGGRLVITTKRSAWYHTYGPDSSPAGRDKMSVELMANDILRDRLCEIARRAGWMDKNLSRWASADGGWRRVMLDL